MPRLPVPPFVLGFILDVSPGTTKGFDPTGTGQPTLFVLRLWNEVFVFRNICPHTGAQLNLKRDVFLSPTGDSLMCYRHGALFDFSGTATAGPCVGRSLEKVPFHITDTGYIVVDSFV